MPPPRTGLLIIRAWREVGSTKPLRAQVRVTDDVALGIERTTILVDPDAVGEFVDAWISGVLDSPEP